MVVVKLKLKVVVKCICETKAVMSVYSLILFSRENTHEKRGDAGG